VLTADPKERVSVQSVRFVFAMLGGLMVTALTGTLVDYFGQGDKAKGYQLAILTMSILGVLMFLACFWGTKERITPPPSQQSSFKDDFKALWQNDQWRVLSIAAVCLLTGSVLRNTLAIYYVKYVLLQPDSIDRFLTLGMLGSIAGCVIAQPLAKRFCKVKLYQTFQILAALMCVGSLLAGTEAPMLALVAFVLWRLFFDAGTPLLWAKMADTVDYGQWKTGIRTTGMVYSSIVFFIKLGLAIGGAAASWLLAGYGYEANVAQSIATQDGILWSFCVYPAVGSLLVAFVMRWYILNTTKVEEITADLQKVS
jgi:GPH family glycoside/pentoside/hexuronide:cation symporter